MAFSDYIRDGFQDIHLAGGFEHSSETLPELAPDGDDAAKSARASRALAIAQEIGAKFDAEYEPLVRDTDALFAEAQRYWTAPVPFGTLPTPPPIELFQQLVATLQRGVGVCQSYDADARKLAESGAPKLKEYIDRFAADAKGALAKLQATPTAGLAGGPANMGAGPGPMMLDPYGNYVPVQGGYGAGPVMPMPYGGPGPFTPPMFGGAFPSGPPFPLSVPFGGPMAPVPPSGGGMTAEQLKIMADSQREVNRIMADTHAATVKSYEAMNKKWRDNF